MMGEAISCQDAYREGVTDLVRALDEYPADLKVLHSPLPSRRRQKQQTSSMVRAQMATLNIATDMMADATTTDTPRAGCWTYWGDVNKCQDHPVAYLISSSPSTISSLSGNLLTSLFIWRLNKFRHDIFVAG